MLTTSTSKTHFIDTNVLLRHANRDSGTSANDIANILEDASQGGRRLWISSILFAELRPSTFRPVAFPDMLEFVKYIRSICEVVSPNANIGLFAARLRDKAWYRPERIRAKEEKKRVLTLGDAVHLATAVWIKEAQKVDDLEFLTFDDGKSDSSELNNDEKSLSLLRLEEYTDGLHDDADVQKIVTMRRLRPVLGSWFLEGLSATPASPIPGDAPSPRQDG